MARSKPRTAEAAAQEVWPEIGVTGLRRFGGHVHEEFLPELRGTRAMKAYREMRDNSAIVGACLSAIEMLIRQVSWSVEPASQQGEDLRRGEFLESCLSDMSFTWAETLGEILTMLPFGFAYHEIVYKRRLGEANDPSRRSKHTDGLVGWRKIPLRGQETLLSWGFDDAGGVQAMRQLAPPDYRLREIPISKALLFRAKSEKNNPEGRSILRNAWLSWYYVKRISEIEGIGIERDLAGLPIAYIPAECLLPDATLQQKATRIAVEEIVTNIRRDEQEGVVFPQQFDERGNPRYKLELLTTGGSRQFDTSKIIERYERRIAMTMLADFVLMGHENVGSFALSSDKTALFAVALGGWLDSIGDIFNQHAVPRLMLINGWPAERAPKLVHGDIEAPNLAALGDYISKLYSAGMQLFPDQGLENHLRRVAGLPRRTGKMSPANLERGADGTTPNAN
jgi:hypothetical protein